jgi:hypothetical protein
MTVSANTYGYQLIFKDNAWRYKNSNKIFNFKEDFMELGREAKDIVTGYKGIVVAVTTYLNGCARIGLQGKLRKDGTVPDFEWFDDLQLVYIGKKKIKSKNRETGGIIPKPHMPKEKDVPTGNIYGTL